eukprot:sb/3471918/
MHVFLTGKPGVGKTTLVKHLLEIIPAGSVSGFFTEEVRGEGGRIGFDVVSVTDPSSRSKLARVGAPGRHKVGKYTVCKDGFEIHALPLLSTPSQVVVIDEVGKMELFSDSFKRKVGDVLDKPGTLVLATVPVQPIPFVNQLKAREDVVLFTITKENRDEMKGVVGDKILEILSNL